MEWSGTNYPEEDSNYCRNPDGRSSGPWCYITEDTTETCNVPFCKRIHYIICSNEQCHMYDIMIFVFMK